MPRSTFTHYSDGSPKVPRLGAMCSPPGTQHRLCGGWWCVCSCHDDVEISETSLIAAHVEHDWQQVEGCVYCRPCGVRLYQGTVCQGDEKAAMAAVWDSIRKKTRAAWMSMREDVLSARTQADD